MKLKVSQAQYDYLIINADNPARLDWIRLNVEVEK